MLGIMSARCGQCGHENNPEYRFCGICGAPLQPATTTREAGTARPPSRVSGPSFLGLGDDHTRDLDYLLEDDPPRGHGRLYLALLLLIASAAVLAWYWRDGNPWTELLRRPQSNTPTVGAGSHSPARGRYSASPAATTCGNGKNGCSSVRYHGTGRRNRPFHNPEWSCEAAGADRGSE